MVDLHIFSFCKLKVCSRCIYKMFGFKSAFVRKKKINLNTELVPVKEMVIVYECK